MENKYLSQYLNAHLRELQLTELDILKKIDQICRNHGIDYWLDGGTCLGAVRHHGFIPWDDDIDIAMRLEDIPRFAEAARKELPPHLFLQSEETDPERRLQIMKVRDLNSYFIEYGDDFNRPYQKGVFVDIFPFIDYPTVSRRFIKRIVGGLCKCHAIMTVQHYYSLRSFAEFFYFGAKKILYSLIWNLVCRTRKHDQYMGNVVHNNGYGIMHRQDSVFPTSDITFEGYTFKAPANPDAYLTDLFKNYMQLPPEDKRKIHSVFFVSKLTNEAKDEAR